MSGGARASHSTSAASWAVGSVVVDGGRTSEPTIMPWEGTAWGGAQRGSTALRGAEGQHSLEGAPRATVNCCILNE